MPILIYCDLDGVLHRWPCRPAEMFGGACVARLEAAIRPYDVGLVITSSWRLEWPLSQLWERMGALGKHVVGMTPEIDDPFLRHGRYREVLLHRAQQSLPDSNWIAIDDEPGRYPETLDNLILTDPKIGFSEEDATRLSSMLARCVSGSLP